MAALTQPSWAELQQMDELTIAGINVVKGEMNGDTYVWTHEEEDERGVVSYGIWKSTLDTRKKKNSGKMIDEEGGYV